MADEEYVWKEEIPVPAHLIQYIDGAVKKALPTGTHFEGITPSGASYWARTAKIEALDDHGNETPFFIKVCHGKAFPRFPVPVDDIRTQGTPVGARKGHGIRGI